MSEGFDVNRYWLERGQNYIAENFPQEFHRLQEKFLIEILKASRIPMDRILEIGCGFGRITKLLAEAFPDSRIAALDLSREQLENARKYCGENSNISFHQYDLYSKAPFPGTEYDLVIAIEVFLHHPRPVVRGFLQRLAGVARHIVNIDWSEDWPWKTPEHVWVHDYSSLYAEAGLRSATFVLPQKVDGLQQKLFIAARQLSPALIHLEQQLRAPEAKPTADKQPLPEVARWPQLLQLAIRDIKKSIPAGATLILVNDDQWGNEERALGGYRIFPFLERDGQYWGPPADDRTALRELARLRQGGATHIVFAWSSFWWLDHYSGFHQHLRSACELVLENERLVIFRLRS